VNFKLRPFQTIIERPDKRPAISAKGEITDDTYIFSLDALSFRLPTMEVGTDTRGTYAIISETEIHLEHGLLLKISLCPDPVFEDMPPGCEIHLVCPGDPRMLQEQLKLNGVDPLKVNLLIPPDASVDVSFNPEGNVISIGCLGKLAVGEYEASSLES